MPTRGGSATSRGLAAPAPASNGALPSPPTPPP
eukprot:CAMPEP_0179140600 /NCGR_PEP_ID=MMETSP0796-20121207/67342_2 /TAXON_ID=73915 /ORGANISM="Pyrodinium bahamense, Strain pbaha01" /LENGTH=32 /DNA_ID= /DNA_START= /DNA_END= /DNA_ORIENTATION=